MFATPILAAGAAASPAGGGLLGILPLVLIFVAFYFLLIRPQQKRVKTLQASIEAVKKNDQVITGGGLVGKVVKVEDRFVEVEIAPNTRVRVVKSTLAEITPAGGKPAND